MFKRRSHLTRILDFMYDNPISFYTIEGFKKFLQDFDELTIRNCVESLEKDGLAESRKVWKAAIETDDENGHPQEQLKGYKLTPRGLALVKTSKRKDLITKIAIIAITITALLGPTVIGIEYFQYVVGEEALPSNQAIPVLVSDTLATQGKSPNYEPRSQQDKSLPEKPD
jgi:hypothetical protein